MKIVFVGAGNLATNVARALKDAGHEITQVPTYLWKSSNPFGN